MTLRLDKQDILLPVIRKPNFSDETADLPMDHFKLTVGNETSNASLKRVSLKEYLENSGGYIKDNKGTPVKSLFCKERDDVILTSAQYCLLPLDKGTCEFNVHLYNYQSSYDDPAVLVVVASAKGSSAQAIYGGTTALYFNNAGKAANFIAERLKDERARLGKTVEGKMDKDEQERNALFIYQIPLKVKETNRYDSCGFGGYEECDEECGGMDLFDDGMVYGMTRSEPRGMDNAMLSVGISHSEFTGISNAEIERDTRFPIRCTIQFYKVTDDPEVPEEEIKDMADNIAKVYKLGEKMGSLVVENSDRKTEWVKQGVPYTKELPDEEKQKGMFTLFD